MLIVPGELKIILMGNKSIQLILKLTLQLVGLALVNCIEVLPLKAQLIIDSFNIPPEDIFDEGIFSELST
ncbi:MAG: hypothetical protein QNJ32_19700 [Xenococcaceae cyanobacterium MO_167.B27]|nr:hypothetical protein [Xenococcaceae cyanobacterium MO_167.B27]